MATDILNSLPYYKEVLPIAPGGGSDGGMDITCKTEDNERCLACVTLQQEKITSKFKKDLSKRKVGDFDKYILICTVSLTHAEKIDITKYCVNNLAAELVLYDREALRSLLDTWLKPIREKYLHISDQSQPSKISQRLLDDLTQLKSDAGIVTECLCGYGAIDPMYEDIRTKLLQINNKSGELLEYKIVVQPIRDFYHSGAWFLDRRKDHDYSNNTREELTVELETRHEALIEACNQLIEMSND